MVIVCYVGKRRSSLQRRLKKNSGKRTIKPGSTQTVNKRIWLCNENMDNILYKLEWEAVASPTLQVLVPVKSITKINN